jgi:predicted HAD superfamily Cof-like phosphohydrolase
MIPSAETVQMKLMHFENVFSSGFHSKIEDLTLRRKLIAEEYEEVDEAIQELRSCLINPDCVGTAYHTEKRAAVLKELCDLVYVAVGTAEKLGMNFDTAFNVVHKNNMSKVGPDGKPVYREDGKLLKPEGYKKVNLEEFV